MKVTARQVNTEIVMYLELLPIMQNSFKSHAAGLGLRAAMERARVMGSEEPPSAVQINLAVKRYNHSIGSYTVVQLHH